MVKIATPENSELTLPEQLRMCAKFGDVSFSSATALGFASQMERLAEQAAESNVLRRELLRSERRIYRAFAVGAAFGTAFGAALVWGLL